MRIPKSTFSLYTRSCKTCNLAWLAHHTYPTPCIGKGAIKSPWLAWQDYHCCHSHKSCILAHPGTPFGRFGPLSHTLKLTNGSDQNFMDPLNFTRHGMSKSFVELLTPKIVIINTKRLENEQIMTQKTKKSSSGGQHSNFWTP